MSIVNFPELRIKKYPKGYAVEIKKKKWYGRNYWVHVISISGMDDYPWYYSNYETAYLDSIRLINKHVTQSI